MSQRVDFSENAKVYDRRHGTFLSQEELSRLSAVAALQPGLRILDIGAGTGRVAIPFADLGCEVLALEPAWGMVEILRAKAGSRRLHIISGDAAHLPFSKGHFDVVVIARLLYLSDIAMGAGQSLTLAEFLRRLVEGELSYVWNVPQSVRAECLPRLRSWCEHTFDLERSIAMPKEIRWSVYRKDAVERGLQPTAAGATMGRG